MYIFYIVSAIVTGIIVGVIVLCSFRFIPIITIQAVRVRVHAGVRVRVGGRVCG